MSVVGDVRHDDEHDDATHCDYALFYLAWMSPSSVEIPIKLKYVLFYFYFSLLPEYIKANMIFVSG